MSDSEARVGSAGSAPNSGGGCAGCDCCHMRWALAVSEYDITIVHRAGAAHANADVPSRFPRPTTEDRTGARLDPMSQTLEGRGAKLMTPDEYTEFFNVIKCQSTGTALTPAKTMAVNVVDSMRNTRMICEALRNGIPAVQDMQCPFAFVNDRQLEEMHRWKGELTMATPRKGEEVVSPHG